MVNLLSDRLRGAHTLRSRSWIQRSFYPIPAAWRAQIARTAPPHASGKIVTWQSQTDALPKYRRPAELLVLAFAKAAQKDLEKRVRDRLGDKAARGLTVRTFHSLGMAIIGEAEGKRPAVAKVTEDEKALLELLKGIVSSLLGDERLSKTLRRWPGTPLSIFRSLPRSEPWLDHEAAEDATLQCCEASVVDPAQSREFNGLPGRSAPNPRADQRPRVSPLPNPDIMI